MQIDNYQIIRILGEGANGLVYLAKKNNKLVALKVLNRNHENYFLLRINMIKEKEALGHLNHPNILKIIEARFGVQWVDEVGQEQCGDYIATEVVGNGELFDFIDNPIGRFSEPVAKHLFI